MESFDQFKEYDRVCRLLFVEHIVDMKGWHPVRGPITCTSSFYKHMEESMTRLITDFATPFIEHNNRVKSIQSIFHDVFPCDVSFLMTIITPFLMDSSVFYDTNEEVAPTPRWIMYMEEHGRDHVFDYAWFRRCVSSAAPSVFNDDDRQWIFFNVDLVAEQGNFTQMCHRHEHQPNASMSWSSFVQTIYHSVSFHDRGLRKTWGALTLFDSCFSQLENTYGCKFAFSAPARICVMSLMYTMCHKWIETACVQTQALMYHRLHHDVSYDEMKIGSCEEAIQRLERKARSFEEGYDEPKRNQFESWEFDDIHPYKDSRMRQMMKYANAYLHDKWEREQSAYEVEKATFMSMYEEKLATLRGTMQHYTACKDMWREYLMERTQVVDWNMKYEVFGVRDVIYPPYTGRLSSREAESMWKILTRASIVYKLNTSIPQNAPQCASFHPH